MEEKTTIELYENRCAVCYKPFFQKRDGTLRRTCSNACRQKLYRMRKANPKPKTRADYARRQRAREAATTCEACGGPIEQKSRGRKRKTCSDACRKRLWRWTNPRCVVCGKHFKRYNHQMDHRFCSRSCQDKARYWRQRAAELEDEYAALRGYRPDWLPEPGSGYREEEVPWENGAEEDEAVIREREAEPHYEPLPWAGLDAAQAQVVEQMVQEAQEDAAKAELERARKARRLAWELLEDESKWF